MLALLLLPAGSAGLGASPAPAPQHTDLYGDPLPPGAVSRLGTLRFRHRQGVYALAFAADGKSIVTASHDKTVRLWDTATGKELRTFRGHTEYLCAVAFSPDGRTVASGGADQTVRLWDVRTGRQRRRLPGGDEVASLAFSPDGSRLAMGSSKALRVWSAATGRTVLEIKNAPGAVYFVAFSPDGKLLASGGSRTIRLWDAATGKELRRLPGHKDEIAARIAFAPDGKTIASASYDAVRLWGVASGKLLWSAPSRISQSVAFSPDGKVVASVEGDSFEGRIHLWDAATGREVRRVPVPAGSHTVVFSPDGKAVAATAGVTAFRIWDRATWRDRPPLQGHWNSVWSLALSPDCRAVASGGMDGTVRAWDAATGRQRFDFRGHEIFVIAVAFSPDGKMVASGDEGGTVRLWDLATGKQRIRKPLPPPSRYDQQYRVHSLVFSPDGLAVASGAESGSVHVWDTTTGKEVCELYARDHPALRFLDARTLAAAGDGGLWLHDIRSGRHLPVLRGEGGQAFGSGRGCRFSSDGRVVAAVRSDGRARFWELPGGRELGRFRVGGPDFKVYAVGLSPDDRLLMVQEGPGRGRLWELATGQEVLAFGLKPGESLWPVFFAADGRPLGALTTPGGLRLRDLAMNRDLLSIRDQNAGGGLVAATRGRRLVTAEDAGAMLVWDLPPARQGKDLAPRDLEALWDRLGGKDAAQAYEAVQKLAGAGDRAVAFFKGHIRPAPVTAPERRIRRLIAELNDDRFTTRAAASRALADIGPEAEPVLREALSEKPPLEVRRRVEGILAGLRAPPFFVTGESLRSVRALQVLEAVGSPAARELLTALAGGARLSRQTQEARAALRRLSRRAAAAP